MFRLILVAALVLTMVRGAEAGTQQYNFSAPLDVAVGNTFLVYVGIGPGDDARAVSAFITWTSELELVGWNPLANCGDANAQEFCRGPGYIQIDHALIGQGCYAPEPCRPYTLTFRAVAAGTATVEARGGINCAPGPSCVQMRDCANQPMDVTCTAASIRVHEVQVQHSVAVTWSDEQVRIQVPEPYLIEFAQWSWIAPADTAAIRIVNPPESISDGWWMGAYNDNCTSCDNDPATIVGIVNGAVSPALLQQTAGEWLDGQPAKATDHLGLPFIDWTWSWAGEGLVNWGNQLMCPNFVNNPCHLWVVDASLSPEHPFHQQIWYCDRIETRLGVQPGALIWSVTTLTVPTVPVQLAVTQKTWTQIRALYR